MNILWFEAHVMVLDNNLVGWVFGCIKKTTI